MTDTEWHARVCAEWPDAESVHTRIGRIQRRGEDAHVSYECAVWPVTAARLNELVVSHAAGYSSDPEQALDQCRAMVGEIQRRDTLDRALRAHAEAVA